jgi:hypothetical protein
VRTLKPKKCRACGAAFTPNRPLQVACTVACAIALDRAKRRKADRKAVRARLAQLKPLRTLLKEAQAAFNRWVVARDFALPCVSCGATGHETDYHKISGWVASHYRSVGACPELRFEPLNVHKACVRCNSHLSGNIVEYRIGLAKRIGAENLAWLEGPHEPKRYRADEAREIKALYQKMRRELPRAWAYWIDSRTEMVKQRRIEGRETR